MYRDGSSPGEGAIKAFETPSFKGFFVVWLSSFKVL